MPIRVQRKRTKGWKMPPNTVSVTRPGLFGNPYKVGRDGTAEECVAKFRAAWEATTKSAFIHPRHPYMPFGKRVYLAHLRGKNLACFCPLDQPCHADVLIELANS